MKKGLLIILLLCAVTISMSACGHEHVWQAASCISPKICPECGETEGEALGHSWIEATCLDAKVCSICLQTMGSPLGHSWQEATCETAKTCKTCGFGEGSPLGHDWNAATCTSAEKCAVCEAEQGEALGHTIDEWGVVADSTCSEIGMESGICLVCGESVEREIALKEHTPGDWEVLVEPTTSSEGTRIKKCAICGLELEKENFTLTPEEIEALYKKKCKSIPYDNLARSPGEYSGEYVMFTGTVVQVCSEASSAMYYSTYRVATSGRYNNVVYIYVDNYGSGSRILEDDRITFYGKFDGLYTYETVLGSSVTIPSVKVQYVD